jgi:hypothetical protein
MTEAEKVDTVYATLEQGHAMPAPNMKRGHKCCGGCCDVRRAVIVVNCISIGILVLGMLTILTVSLVDPNSFTDDSVKATFDQFDAKSAGIACAIMLVQMLFYAMGVYGAIKFNEGFVIAALVAYIVIFVVDAIALNIGGILLNGFFAYPHFYFIKEMRDGIMTEENYPNEKQSCCCV